MRLYWSPTPEWHRGGDNFHYSVTWYSDSDPEASAAAAERERVSGHRAYVDVEAEQGVCGMISYYIKYILICENPVSSSLLSIHIFLSPTLLQTRLTYSLNFFRILSPTTSTHSMNRVFESRKGQVACFSMLQRRGKARNLALP